VEGLTKTLGAPETQGFWTLKRQARLLREAGFSASSYELYWHQLLALPLSLMAMTVIAAAASLRLARRGGAFQLAVIGGGVGFLSFFANRFLGALATTDVMPVMLAAWGAPLFTVLGGVFVIAAVEDG
jgi:lipopolysaccharide export system permease protein